MHSRLTQAATWNTCSETETNSMCSRIPYLNSASCLERALAITRPIRLELCALDPVRCGDNSGEQLVRGVPALTSRAGPVGRRTCRRPSCQLPSRAEARPSSSLHHPQHLARQSFGTREHTTALLASLLLACNQASRANRPHMDCLLQHSGMALASAAEGRSHTGIGTKAGSGKARAGLLTGPGRPARCLLLSAQSVAVHAHVCEGVFRNAGGEGCAGRQPGGGAGDVDRTGRGNTLAPQCFCSSGCGVCVAGNHLALILLLCPGEAARVPACDGTQGRQSSPAKALHLGWWQPWFCCMRVAEVRRPAPPPCRTQTLGFSILPGLLARRQVQSAPVSSTFAVGCAHKRASSTYINLSEVDST